MSLFHAILLGLVQGLGEFLPISSSGHLIIFPWLFGFPDPGLAFDVALHLGTLIAIVAYFWRDWVEIIYNLQFTIYNKFSIFNFQNNSKSKLPITNYELQNSEKLTYNKNILLLIIIATIPGAIFGLIFEKKAETIFRNPLLIAFTLIIVGLILYLADKYAKHKRNINNITKKDALIIGLSQAVAIIPGVSRSGSTITTGLFLGLDRVSAARFSFLLSAPIIFGAALVKFPAFIKSSPGVNEYTAILVSAISGYLAIAWMLKFISKISYKVFFWYRLALAIVIVGVWLLR